MSLKVIKFVAGGGKTTESKELLLENRNCIYLAFNNKVVDELSFKGFLSKTIDSFFVSFIIPKFIDLIPLIANESEICFCDKNNVPGWLIGVLKINIKIDGFLYNQTSKTVFSLEMKNAELYKMKQCPNFKFINYIFSRDKLMLTNTLRDNLCSYLLEKFQDKIIEIIEKRFEVVIIDEAQDLKGYREKFAELLARSKVKLYVFGDDYQNINGGGKWFLNLTSDNYKNISHRCPEKNCKWIRDNMNIEIYGENKQEGGVIHIDLEEAKEYDNSKRVLLYKALSGRYKSIADEWKGPKYTIQAAKGMTIYEDIVIIGGILSDNFLYTAITRTTKKCFFTVKMKSK